MLPLTQCMQGTLTCHFSTGCCLELVHSRGAPLHGIKVTLPFQQLIIKFIMYGELLGFQLLKLL